ncbi:MAG: exo-alpha-sialidase [Rhodospirillales bacterium]
MRAEFVFDEAPFAAAHASTVAETASGLVAAWFAGPREGHRDVAIWLARRRAAGWSAPVRVADGVQSDGRRLPCWNPVLHRVAGGPLLLFYKVGPSPSRWWGMMIASADDGATWTPPRRLPDGILGPVKNKPLPLVDGTLLCPSSSEHDRWRVHVEATADLGETWRRSPALNDGATFAAIQPTLVRHPDGRLQMLCRSRQGVIAECWSEDDGAAWSPLAPTTLPNPDSGIDAVSLADGRVLLVYNHAGARWRRTPLNLALSADGRRWRAVGVLEDGPGEYSYPAVIQAADGLVHVTYTWNRRRIRHVTLDPADLASPTARGRD